MPEKTIGLFTLFVLAFPARTKTNQPRRTDAVLYAHLICQSTTWGSPSAYPSNGVRSGRRGLIPMRMESPAGKIVDSHVVIGWAAPVGNIRRVLRLDRRSNQNRRVA